MKLIFLITHLRPWGTERVAVLMANHYATMGLDVTLLVVGRPGGVFRFEIDPRVKVDYLNLRLESGFNLFRKIESFFAIRKYFKRALNEPGVTDTQNNYPGENNPTILLGIGNFPIILAAMLPKGKQIRTIGCLHTPYKSIEHIWKFLRWLFYRRLDMIVSLTNRDLSRLKRHNPNVRTIPNQVTFYPENPAKLGTK